MDESDSDSGTDSVAEEREEGAAEESKDTAAEYEEQRMKRIKENNERMEAMGLRKMSSFFRVCDDKKVKRKLKGKAKLDEEYMPSDDEDEASGSEDEDGKSEDDDDEEFVGDRPHKPAKKKVTKKTKKVSVQNLMETTEVVDEDEDLKLAIALSLREAEKMKTVQSVVYDDADVKDITVRGKREDVRTRNDKVDTKRKKKMSSRAQMKEDEIILHFFQFDEAGKGGINVRDLRRMAYAHDFTWTDEEMADMIKYFDSDRDGKLSLDDFRCIVERCNMVQRPENVKET